MREITITLVETVNVLTRGGENNLDLLHLFSLKPKNESRR